MPLDRSDSAPEHKAVTDDLLARFSWPVEEEFMRDAFEVVTDWAQRKHVVFWPRESDPAAPSFARYLHEMGHALLAEQAHQQFSRPFFARGTDPALRNTYAPLFDAALDWYVQELIMGVAPQIQAEDIDARFRQTALTLRQGAALPSVEFVVDAGLALASFKHSRGLDVSTQGKLADVVEAFLRTPPDKPTLFGLQNLIRRLLECFGSHTASLVSEKGFERWRIVPLKKG
jgi:hypothetical protein